MQGFESKHEGEIEVSTSEVRNLTAFQRNILTVLASGSTYGLGIKRELESYYGSDVNHGRLYPNLDELVEMGLIEKGEIDKRTNEYTLTDAGSAVLLDQLEWTLSKLREDGERMEQVQEFVTSDDD